MDNWKGFELWELESVIPLESEKEEVKKTVKAITSLSGDTVKRLFPEKVVHLSARRQGMKLKHALQIAEGMD
jgi:hypothetical protein